MFAPNISTHQLADQIHSERLEHAARLQMVSRDRSDDAVIVDRQAQRRSTSRRLAATLVAAALSLGIAAMAAAQGTDAPAAGSGSTAPAHSSGGGVTLIR
ncbi:MAG: hypothetical protein ABIO99_00755 [Candidatus Limnocylindria bacterium]